MVWFSRKTKHAPGRQAAQSNAPPKIYPPSSNGYQNPSSSNQATSSAGLGQQLVADLVPLSPSRPPPCDICAVWIKAFESLEPDDFIRVHIFVADLLSAASNGCQVCCVIRDLYPKLTPYRDGAVRSADIRLLIEQQKGKDGTKEEFGCLVDLDDEDGTQMNIYCTQELPCPWGHFPTGTPSSYFQAGKNHPALTGHVKSGSGIDSCVKITELWLHHCMKNHQCTPADELQPLPSRVISIGENVHDLKLIETNHFKGRYICLSYCWGVNKTFDTTTKNRIERLTSIKYTDMPKTYRDAVAMCHKLGISFLWIDALCILQDSPSDWAQESAQMADIYSRSFLTLAGNRAADVHAGLFHSQRQPENRGTTAQGHPFRYFIAGNDLYPNFLGRGDDHAVFPLLARAWTFQEILLAPRTLHFEQAELSWRCHAQSWCECQVANGIVSYKINYARALRNLAVRNLLTDNEIQGLAFMWRSLVVDYGSKALSHTTDKLPALSGLARQFLQSHQQHRDGETYLAGLWRASLLDDMLWYTRPQRRPKQPEPTVWRAPSWSWASNDSEIFYLVVDSQYSWQWHSPNVQPWVFAAECTLAGADPTGQVTAGQVKLRGRTLTRLLKLRKSGKQQFHYDLYLPSVHGSEDFYTTEDVPATVTGRRNLERRLWLDHVQPNAANSDRPRETIEVQCLLMARFERAGSHFVAVYEPFLLLEAVSESGDPGRASQTYRRIGIGNTSVEYWYTEKYARGESSPIENVKDITRSLEGAGFTDKEKQAYWRSYSSSFEKFGVENTVTII